MDYLDQLEWVNWKKLTDFEKEVLFKNIICNKIPANLKVGKETLVDFELCGIKCRTYELELNDELFLFVPGNTKAILGWELGSQGLSLHELLGYDPKRVSEETFKTALTASELPEIEGWEKEKKEYNLYSLDDIGIFINENTTPLRKVGISPMLVQKYALPAGTQFLGILDTVTGGFKGDIETYAHYEKQIMEELFPVNQAVHNLYSAYERFYVKQNQFYLELVPDSDQYFVYSYRAYTHQELKTELSRDGFDLLTEDQWEYVVGAGTRRLFRWGNELRINDSELGKQVLGKMNGPNMFGLAIDVHQNYFELTNDPNSSKLNKTKYIKNTLIERMLPLSTYYTSRHKIGFLQKLDPSIYSYRKMIAVEID